MTKIFSMAALISAPYSLVVAFISVFVTMPWVRVFENGSQTTIHGLDAILYLIKTEGFFRYVLGLAPQFFFFLFTVFFALVIQGFLLRARKNA